MDKCGLLVHISFTDISDIFIVTMVAAPENVQSFRHVGGHGRQARARGVTFAGVEQEICICLSIFSIVM